MNRINLFNLYALLTSGIILVDLRRSKAMAIMTLITLLHERRSWL